MTRNEILEMQAGAEIDALIAEHIFDWKWEERDGRQVLVGPVFERLGAKFAPTYWPDIVCAIRSHDPLDMPCYSTDIAAAWKVAEALTEYGRTPHSLYFRLTWGWWNKPHSDDYPQCWAAFDWKETGDSHPLYLTPGQSAPLAICRAALLAIVGEKEDEEEDDDPR